MCVCVWVCGCVGMCVCVCVCVCVWSLYYSTKREISVGRRETPMSLHSVPRSILTTTIKILSNQIAQYYSTTDCSSRLIFFMHPYIKEVSPCVRVICLVHQKG